MLALLRLAQTYFKAMEARGFFHTVKIGFIRALARFLQYHRYLEAQYQDPIC